MSIHYVYHLHGDGKIACCEGARRLEKGATIMSESMSVVDLVRELALMRAMYRDAVAAVPTDFAALRMLIEKYGDGLGSHTDRATMTSALKERYSRQLQAIAVKFAATIDAADVDSVVATAEAAVDLAIARSET